MSDVIKFTVESTYPEMCSVNVPLQETISLYGGLISRLLVACVIR